MSTIKFICICIISSSLLLGAEAFASAGKIIYAHGDNYALNKDGKKRKVTRNTEVFAGDTLVTGNSGRMHLRFSDGGMVSVYPRSEYKIDEYEFVENDAKKQKGFFSLLKGGARQITGLLGKHKRDDFRFRTTVATIGIRGTGFYVQLCNGDCYDGDGQLLADGMYVKNDTGIISMDNEAGGIELAQGQSAYAASSSNLPEQILEPPAPYNLAFDDVETFDFNVANALAANMSASYNEGAPPVESPPLPQAITLTKIETLFLNGSGNAVQNTIGPGLNTISSVSSIQNNAASITGYNIAVQVAAGAPQTEIFASTGATLIESGSNSTLGVAWSRWNGGFTLTRDGVDVGPSDQNIHVIGANQLTQAFPTAARGNITYSGTSGTNPTFSGTNGNLTGTQSVAFDINYGTGEVTNLALTTTFSGGQVVATLTGTSGNNMNAVASNVFAISGPCPNTLCDSANGLFVNGNMSINLVGTNAEGAFGTYALGNPANEAISGSYLATGN